LASDLEFERWREELPAAAAAAVVLLVLLSSSLRVSRLPNLDRLSVSAVRESVSALRLLLPRTKSVVVVELECLLEDDEAYVFESDFDFVNCACGRGEGRE
jgi:hypothetical protein